MKIEHIAITVSDLERAKDFFVKYFGCTLGTNYHNPRTGLHSCFVRFDGETRLLHEKIFVSAGQRGMQLRLSPQDLINYVPLTVSDLI